MAARKATPTRRSPSQNARKHGLAAAVRVGSDEARYIDELTTALALELEAEPDILPVLQRFAAAQFKLERIAAIRERADDEIAENGTIVGRSTQDLLDVVSDLLDFEQVNSRAAAGAGSAGSDGRVFNFVSDHDNPEGEGVLQLLAFQGELARLDRYERRALGERRKAIEQITGYEISRRFQRQKT